MPDLEVTGEPQWLRSSSINGIKHLRVRFRPGRKRAETYGRPRHRQTLKRT